MTASNASPALPKVLDEIASIVGVDHALTLASLRGGQMITIPAQLRRNNWIVLAIGEGPAQALSDHFTSGRSRMSFDLPRGPACGLNASASTRAQIVRDGVAKGLTGNQIAQLAGITRRSVQRQVSKIRREAKAARAAKVS